MKKRLDFLAVTDKWITQSALNINIFKIRIRFWNKERRKRSFNYGNCEKKYWTGEALNLSYDIFTTSKTNCRRKLQFLSRKIFMVWVINVERKRGREIEHKLPFAFKSRFLPPLSVINGRCINRHLSIQYTTCKYVYITHMRTTFSVLHNHPIIIISYQSKYYTTIEMKLNPNGASIEIFATFFFCSVKFPYKRKNNMRFVK